MSAVSRICQACSNVFEIDEKYLRYEKKRGRNAGKYCSHECSYSSQITSITISCHQCGNSFLKRQSQIKKSKNNFCSTSCAATYNNRHKTTGTRRSKLEAYIEQRIRETYPDLELIVNGKVAVGQELDFYFPTLNMALEINGIFHYKPIYGEAKLKQIKNNDELKLKACSEKGIRLLIHSDRDTRFAVKTAEVQWEDIRRLCQLG
jgi:hypothetical protein